MKRVALLSLLFPFLLILFCVRLAFTGFFVELNYRFGDLPPDRWGMDQAQRLDIAKLGLRSVLSEEGMKEFVNSGLFRDKEIRHMQDVKNLLSLLFGFLYLFLPFWLLLFFSLRDKKKMGLTLFLGATFGEVLAVFVVVFSVINYELLFEAFHDLVFEPGSWRFLEEDMLLRVYPMEFWYNATVWVSLLVFALNSLLQGVGFILWRKTF
ncbi:TIGR01906 family membrane protein [Thermocrinis sp.]